VAQAAGAFVGLEGAYGRWGPVLAPNLPRLRSAHAEIGRSIFQALWSLGDSNVRPLRRISSIPDREPCSAPDRQRNRRFAPLGRGICCKISALSGICKVAAGCGTAELSSLPQPPGSRYTAFAGHSRDGGGPRRTPVAIQLQARHQDSRGLTPGSNTHSVQGARAHACMVQ
jgi:hypothetical protein